MPYSRLISHPLAVGAGLIGHQQLQDAVHIFRGREYDFNTAMFGAALDGDLGIKMIFQALLNGGSHPWISL